MTSGQYALRIKRADGYLLDTLDTQDWHELQYRRPINAPGALSLVLRGSYDMDLLAVDNRIDVLRSVPGYRSQYLDTDTTWLIRKTVDRYDQNGQHSIVVSAVSALDLLRRRIVAYDSGTAYALKNSQAADTMITTIVQENLGSSATDTARQLSTSYLTIATAAGTGATVSKGFSRRNVLTVCQEIAQASTEAGTPVFFDVVATMGVAALNFQTFVSVRGIDHSFPDGIRPVVLSLDKGTLSAPSLTRDYSEEANYIYAAGQGESTSRDEEVAYDSTRIGASIFNRIEDMVDARHIDLGNTAALQAEANAGLRAGRPRRIFQGTITNAPGAIYGYNWEYGDEVTAELNGESFHCRISLVDVRVAAGVETISANLQAED